MVLLFRNNATINVHVSDVTTQNQANHPWSDPTRLKSLTRSPVTRFQLWLAWWFCL